MLIKDELKKKVLIPYIIKRLSVFLSIILSNGIYAQVDPTPARERIESLERKKNIAQNSFLNIKFRSIGPSIMSGRVTDIDVNPNDPTEFYVVYATGGVWWTINNGQSFTPIFDSVDVLSIGDIAVNWKTRRIWVGTGEANSHRSSHAGIGVYNSDDNGKHWKYLGLSESHAIGKIQLDPNDDNVAWVAVMGHLFSPNKQRGVYKTTDGGKTWKQTLFIDESTGVIDLAINQMNPKELYAATWHRERTAWNFTGSGNTSGIYKSTDGGITWKLLTIKESGFPQGKIVGRIGLAIFPSNPKIIYAVVDNKTVVARSGKVDSNIYFLRDFKDLSKSQFADLDNEKLNKFLSRVGLSTQGYTADKIKDLVESDKIKPTDIYKYFFSENRSEDGPVSGCEVYRSNNGGLNWQKTNTRWIDSYNSFGYFFGKIYVSPYNEKKIVVLGIKVLLSNDAGRTFAEINKENVHVDGHACWINPVRDNHIIIGNDGGCDITYDDGQHWLNTNSPPVGQFYAIAVDNSTPYNVYGGLQDNGNWWGPSNNEENSKWHKTGNYSFKQFDASDGFQIQVDSRGDTIVYCGSQYGMYSKYNRTTLKQIKSFKPRHYIGQSPLRFNWQTPILLSRHNQDVLYYGSNVLYRSLNGGDTLIAISEDLTKGTKKGNVSFGTITTITESPLRFGLLYVGTDDGNLQVSKDGGKNWILIRLNFPNIADLWVSRVVASQYKESRVYVTLNGRSNDNFLPYLFVSEDYGSSWDQLGSDLPFEPINVIREDPTNENILYVGTDGGLYVSFNRGRSFMIWNAGLPKCVAVNDIAIQARDNEIVLGTYGRSLYVAKLDDVQKPRCN